MKRRMWIALIALALLMAACTPSAPASTRPVSLRVGSNAPDFTLKTLDSREVHLADYRGRPVFINFWASWCGPCRGEMPAIVAAYRAHQDTGLIVLAIDLTTQDTVKNVRAFVTEFKMPFPVLLDEEGRVATAYSPLGLPSSMFIDPDGIVRAVHPGPMTREVIEQHLAEIMP